MFVQVGILTRSKMVADELIKPILISYGLGVLTGILLCGFAIINIIKAFWGKITGIFRQKKAQSGTAWLIFMIGLLLIAFIMAVPPDYRLWLLG
jgi:hypothetical protein